MRIGEIDYPVVRVKFKKFLALEEIRERLMQATDTQDDQLSILICDYVSVALSCPREELDTLPWRDVAVAMSETFTANVHIRKLPFMKSEVKTDGSVEPWEYPGRVWYMYAYQIAKEFGWSMEYVAELDVDDAFSILQEIMIQRQLDREWQWDLSEKSVGYDESTKKSKYNPLPRPDWMKAPIAEPKKIKILRSHMPMGVIIRPDGSHVEHP